MHKKVFAAPELIEFGILGEITGEHDPNTGQNPCNAEPNGRFPEHAKQGPSYDCMSIGSS
jgi:hypothetical protein